MSNLTQGDQVNTFFYQTWSKMLCYDYLEQKVRYNQSDQFQ